MEDTGAEIAFAAYGDPRFEALLENRTAAPLPTWCARAETDYQAAGGRLRTVAYAIAAFDGARRVHTLAEAAATDVDPSGIPDLDQAIVRGEAAAQSAEIREALAHEGRNAETEHNLRGAVLAGAKGFTASTHASEDTADEAARLRTLLDDSGRHALDIPMEHGLARTAVAAAGLDTRDGVDGKAIVRFERPYLESLHAILRRAAREHPLVRDAIRALDRQHDGLAGRRKARSG